MNPRPWLFLLCIGRFGSACVYMVFAATLPETLGAWSMTGGQAGLVQFLTNVGFGTSMVATSLIADRLGAKRVLLVSLAASAVSSMIYGLFARSFATAAVFSTLVGLTLGGTYAPTLILITQRIPVAWRNEAMGWNFAATSVGYAVTLAGSAAILALSDHRAAYLIFGAAPIAGLIASWIALRDTPNQIAAHDGQPRLRAVLADRGAQWLTFGYTCHTWEVLGIWGWAPVFLAACFAQAGYGQAEALGPAAAMTLHVLGAGGNLTAGIAADRIGRRRTIIAMALMAALSGALAGFSLGLSPFIAVALIAFAGFAAVGDSSAMTAAMADTVPPSRLGAALAVRSVFGSYIGALSPFVFGVVLDATNPAGIRDVWVPAFLTLATAGALAAFAISRLPADRVNSGR